MLDGNALTNNNEDSKADEWFFGYDYDEDLGR